MPQHLALVWRPSTRRQRGATPRGSKFPSAVTRGGAIRTERDRRAEHYTTVSDLSGIDCSGATDSTAGLQNAITGGAVLKFPLGCRIVLSNTITVRSRSHVKLFS